MIGFRVHILFPLSLPTVQQRMSVLLLPISPGPHHIQKNREEVWTKGQNNPGRQFKLSTVSCTLFAL